MTTATHLTKQYTLRAIHKLNLGEINEPLHGHDYKIEVTLKGQVSRDTQWIISRDKLDQVVYEHLIHKFDKTDLNESFEFTSGECLVKAFFKILKNSPIGQNLVKLALQETKKNRFVCYG